MAGEVVLDLGEALVADPDLGPVPEDEPAPEAAADEEAGRVPEPGGEPGDRDQQVDVDRALAGDRAAESITVSPGTTSPTKAPVSAKAKQPTSR